MNRGLAKAFIVFLFACSSLGLSGAGERPPDEPTTRIRWTRGPQVPLPTMESLTVQIGNQLFMMGGFSVGLRAINDVQILNLDTMTWTSGAPLPQSQTHVGITTDGRYIYIAGGQFGDKTSKNIRAETFQYDIEKNVWSAFTPLPEPRCAGALVHLNGTLHYFAGDLNDRLTLSDKHWTISTNGEGGWVEKAPVINPGDHLSAAVLNGKIFAIGGEHDHGFSHTPHDAVSMYDPERNTWISQSPLLIPSSHFEGGTIVVHGRIIAMGGQEYKSIKINRVHIYDPQADSWSAATPLPVPIKGGSGAFHNNRLYYVSGRDETDVRPRLNSKEIYIGEILNPWW